EATLRAAMVTSGPFAGRFADQGSDFGDFANNFGTAFAVIGLGQTAAGVPDQALTFLLGQQCPGGGFPADSAAAPTCTSDTDADPEATGLVLQALTGLPTTAAIATATGKAAAWLESVQLPDGSFADAGTGNANSTGIAGAGLRSAGRTAAANQAA